MKFTTLIALVGVTSAVHIRSNEDPVIQIKAGNETTDPTKSGTTGGQDTKTLQAKTPAPDTATEFKPRAATWPSVEDATHGFQDGQRFQIHSTMDGGRVLYASHTPIETISTHPVGKYEVLTHSNQFEVHLHEATGSNNEFWYWHEKS